MNAGVSTLICYDENRINHICQPTGDSRRICTSGSSCCRFIQLMPYQTGRSTGNLSPNSEETSHIRSNPNRSPMVSSNTRASKTWRTVVVTVRTVRRISSTTASKRLHRAWRTDGIQDVFATGSRTACLRGTILFADRWWIQIIRNFPSRLLWLWYRQHQNPEMQKLPDSSSCRRFSNIVHLSIVQGTKMKKARKSGLLFSIPSSITVQTGRRKSELK